MTNVFLLCISCVSGAVDSGDRSAVANQILQATGVRGGLIVHLGCGTGQLTCALRASDALTVHGLDSDQSHVVDARKYIQLQGKYGSVSVEVFSGKRLPYVDNLINLVVADDPGEVSLEEMLRVVAPQGVVYLRQGDGWRKVVKPRSESTDEWTHFLHDASNNAVAEDTVVGPPRSLQWVAPPLWLRSHETPSGVEGLVSAGGRIFYFFDEGLIGITDQRLPERWSLICRDAYNGRLLWKLPVATWGWPEWAPDKFADQDWTTIRGGRTVVPEQNQRRLAAQGDRLYATLAYRAPLSILDASTGKVLATVKETEPVKEILASDGIVVVYSQPASAAKARRRGDESVSSTLRAVDGNTGKILWEKQTRTIPDLFLAIEGGRVFYQAASALNCLDLKTGKEQWRCDMPAAGGLTLLSQAGVVVIYAKNNLQAYDATTGNRLWAKKVPPSAGNESPDVFVARGLVWRGMIPINENQEAVNKSADAMALGFDLRSGEERRRIVVPQLRSPEHHHRCYRNKATERYLISGMEGAEFMDLAGENHGQNNWLRGACKLGVMPCNGLLYVPPDQCFCQPGGKLLGFAAVASERGKPGEVAPDDLRLEKGPAFGTSGTPSGAANEDDWPTYRHDPSRHASTPSKVPPRLAHAWTAQLRGGLTAPVAAAGRVYVAARDAHQVHALDMQTGNRLWSFTAGGRIDSPPTICGGLLLFGSADGRVYCLRADDGALTWRFLAAPSDLRLAAFDQVESVWPVHGSVLVRQGVAYATAGRSTYLDGGIRLWALDAQSGKILGKNILSGPVPDVKKGRDLAFFVPGANSDVLVSEGEHLYMRQKKLTLGLREVEIPTLSNKGEQDVGLHVFSTSGLLDGSWYNRTFWMYTKRWPGFQLANQAPKAGQLLVVDDENTFAVNPFYRRNVHSPMFFPGKEGYLLFADKNSTEPQIVGEPGAKKPVEWLPQSHIPRDGNPGLDSPAFGLDKMIGYTRAEPPLWTAWVPIRIRAMVKAGGTLFVAGPPDMFDANDPYGAFEGRKGAQLAAFSARDGQKAAERELPAPPIFDGLIAAQKRLFVALENDSIVCLAGTE